MKPVDGNGGLQQVLALRQQIVDRNHALQQLRDADQIGAAATGTGMANDPNTGFADTLKTAVNEVSATQNRASDLAAAYERGEVTDIAQVMLARQESGIAFEATLQVRNKLLAAYQEIMRMGA